MLALRRHARLPIHAHRNGWGALSRHPALGFDYVAWSMIWRLAGADHMHVNGLRNKFCEADDSVIASARSLADADVRGRALRGDAGVLLRASRCAQVGGHLGGARVGRPDPCGGRRDHGASAADRRRASRRCARPGRRRWRASRVGLRARRGRRLRAALEAFA